MSHRTKPIPQILFTAATERTAFANIELLWLEPLSYDAMLKDPEETAEVFARKLPIETMRAAYSIAFDLHALWLEKRTGHPKK
jgi:hypothetical protein